MSRRIFTDVKRQQLTQEALLQLRAVRRTIAPDILDRARKVIADQVEKQKTLQDNKAAAVANGAVPVDRTRNLSVVMKFLELKAGDKALQKQVSSLLPEA